MTIYGAGYRTLDYQQTGMWTRMWPVAWNVYRGLFRKRAGILLFVACMGPALFNIGVMMLQMGVMSVGASAEHLQTLREMSPRMNAGAIEFYLATIVEYPSFLAFVVLCAVVACRAIAKDRETGALEIYWTRCIEPRGYLFAKWLGSFLLVATVTVAAPLITWVMACLIAPDWSYLESSIAFVPRVLLAITLFTAVMTWLAVMFSSVATTANMASILWFSMLIGMDAIVRALVGLFHGEWAFKALNPWDAMQRITEWLSGYTPNEDFPVSYALISIAVVVGGLTAWSLRKMRRVEAIG